MSAASSPWRLFVSIAAPEDTARQLLRALRKFDLPPIAPYRECPLAQVHMTVQFIGDTQENKVDDVVESVVRSASGIAPFELRPIRLITLPERGWPRLVAAETDAPPGLLEVQRRLAARLARDPRKRAGDRFLPHLTLCRFTGGARAPAVDQPLDVQAFRVDHLHLMRSVLRPSGAEHFEVHRAALR